MRVTVGLALGEMTLMACDDRAQRDATVGDVAWSPIQLLRDLELRLGIGEDVAAQAPRVTSWQERLVAMGSRQRFYTRSFAVDALGTAKALLALRDSLVEAGWNGQPITDGGERLSALAELEQLGVPTAPGPGDRLRAVERALGAFGHRIYDQILLVEPVVLWSLRWRRIFQRLALAGTSVHHAEPRFGGCVRDGDLGRIQTALDRKSETPVRVDGDGSFVLLTAETSWEAARTTAALLAEGIAGDTVVIREGDASALDHALAAAGLATRGVRATSPWRAALQVLPLALELVFEPKDPCRVLDLLGVPGGPFRGRVGRQLARALARSPGIGSPAWEKAKAELAEIADVASGESGRADPSASSAEVVRRIETWLEAPGADPSLGVTRASLGKVVERVHDWLLARIAALPDDGTLLAAASVAAEIRAALDRDPRDRFDPFAVRQLAALALGDGSSQRSLPEQSGRIDHVDHAGALMVARKNVVWWFFADTGRRPKRLPWRRHELQALNAAGVTFADPRARLTEVARQRRRALLCATERLVLVAPRACARDRLALDPIWQDIQAAAQLDDAACHRVTLAVRMLRQTTAPSLLPSPRQVALPLAPLPGGRTEWEIDPMHLSVRRPFSATSVSALLACPLRWVFAHASELKSTRLDLPPMHRLAGNLGHRLVERLHEAGAFDEVDALLEERARAELEELIRREGALLTRPGMSFERAQIAAQLLSATVELQRALRRSGLRIIRVEHELRMPWRGGDFLGRIDVVVASPDGGEHILDLKWGSTSYRDALREGRALQLAAYSALGTHQCGKRPDAGFFSLRRAKLFGLVGSALPLDEWIRGSSLDATWQAANRSMDAVEASLRRGAVPVTGLQRSLPLLDALGIAPSEQPSYFSVNRKKVCEHCDFDALCGRRWEGGV